MLPASATGLSAPRRHVNLVCSPRERHVPHYGATRYISASSRSACVARAAVDQAECADTDKDAFKHTHDAIMMQGFGWDSCDQSGWYQQISAQVDSMKDLGVTQVWLPPPSQSVSRQGYLPGQLYDLDTPYGTKNELVTLLQQLRAAGIAPLADIVINHRCADQQDGTGRWNIFTDKVEHPGKTIAWGQWAIVGADGFGGMGSIDSGAMFEPAPDLDHKNEHVRESLKDWLRWLNTHVGYEGFRLDYIKGYAPQFVKEYVVDTVGMEAPNVGEYWTDMNWEGSTLGYDQNSARQALCDVLDRTENALNLFDFPTKGILQEAVRNVEYWRLSDKDGKPPGLMGWWPGRAVTFLDNHDTGSTQQHWPFPENRIMTGYAYIFTHPGIPCIMHEHVFQKGMAEDIKKLAEIRRRNGLHSKSSVKIHAAEHDMYVACIDDKVTVKLGPRYDMGRLVPRKEEGWAICASGKDFAVWQKFDANMSRDEAR